MKGIQIKKLPKGAQKVGHLYFTSKCYYVPYVNCYGESVFVRFKKKNY